MASVHTLRILAQAHWILLSQLHYVIPIFAWNHKCYHQLYLLIIPSQDKASLNLFDTRHTHYVVIIKLLPDYAYFHSETIHCQPEVKIIHSSITNKWHPDFSEMTSQHKEFSLFHIRFSRSRNTRSFGGIKRIDYSL